jgi:hypothetical protein
MENDMVYNLSEVSKEALYDKFPAMAYEVDQNGLVDFQRDCLVQAINIVFPTSSDVDKVEIALAMIADPLSVIEKKPDMKSAFDFGVQLLEARQRLQDQVNPDKVVRLLSNPAYVIWLGNCQRFQNQVDLGEDGLVTLFVGYLYRKQACR